MNKDFFKMLTELEGISERIDKTNRQRMSMVILLSHLMKFEGVPFNIKASIAASMMDVLDEHMIPEDGPIIQMLNDAIDSVCEEAEAMGTHNLRGQLNRIRKECTDQAKRQMEGEKILKSMNFGDINLN